MPTNRINPHILDEEVDINEGIYKEGEKYIWKMNKETGEWEIEMLDQHDLPLVTLPVPSADRQVPQYQGTGKKGKK
jgi:hypothetical protein